MNFITTEDLQQHHKQAAGKFESSAVYTDPRYAELKSVLSSCYAFSSAAAHLSCNIDQNIRSNLNILFKNNNSDDRERRQVTRHKLGDLWGAVLTLENSVKFYEKSIASNMLSAGLLADTDSLYRTAEDTLALIDKFNRSEIKSDKINGLLNTAFSLINSNDVSKLSQSAVDYFIQLA